MASSRARIWGLLRTFVQVVIPQQVEDGMDGQISQLPLDAVAELLRLGLGPVQVNDHVPQGSTGRSPGRAPPPRCRLGGLPGVRFSMGKERTSVTLSTSRCSRLISRMPSSSVRSTSTPQGSSPPPPPARRQSPGSGGACRGWCRETPSQCKCRAYSSQRFAFLLFSSSS